jgi:hypothetical protein
MAKGYATSADILTRTRDGQDLNKIWNDYQAALSAFNSTRQPLIDLLSFSVTNVIEDIVQPGTERFEEATEFGIPVSIRPVPVVTQRAFPFKWYDMRAAYTFQYLAGGPNALGGATSQQLDAVLQTVMEAENALQFDLVMKALFNNVNRSAAINSVAYTVTALYNADSSYIPPYKSATFNPATHTHYIASAAATLDSTDLTDLSFMVEEHGYNRQNGYTTILLVNKTEADVIRTFRRGVVNNNAQTAVYDFIPAQGMGFQLPVGWEVAAGSQPGQTFANMQVAGAYGNILVVEDPQIPSGWMVAAASAGRSSQLNIVGLREPEQPGLQGLVLRPGNNQNYPLIDSFFIRGLGSGVAQRGAAAIMKITAGAYSVPTGFVW